MGFITTIKYQNELELHECPSCGINFAIPIRFNKEMENTHKTFYCPKGHTIYYPQESKEEKYKRLYKTEKNCCRIKRDKLEGMYHRYNGLKGYVAKLKKQIPIVN